MPYVTVGKENGANIVCDAAVPALREKKDQINADLLAFMKA